jgi:hypothetical protein
LSYEEEFEDRISAFLRSLEKEKEAGGREGAGRTVEGKRERAGWPARHPAVAGPAWADRQSVGPGLFDESAGRPYYWRHEQVFQNAVAKFHFYLQLERENYFPAGVPVPDEDRPALAGFYSEELLDGVRIVHPSGQRVSNPWFYSEAKAAGLTNLPDIAHKAAVTFLDVIVFNEKLTRRDLFHGLVHVAQVRVLGAERFSELFVRGFLQARSYFLVPLKAHAFALDARFASASETRFPVEEEVRRWAADDRY